MTINPYSGASGVPTFNSGNAPPSGRASPAQEAPRSPTPSRPEQHQQYLRSADHRARSNINWVKEGVKGAVVGTGVGVFGGGFPATAATFIARAVDSPLSTMAAFSIGYGAGMASCAVAGAALSAYDAVKRQEKETNPDVEAGGRAFEGERSITEGVKTPVHRPQSLASFESARHSVDLDVDKKDSVETLTKAIFPSVPTNDPTLTAPQAIHQAPETQRSERGPAPSLPSVLTTELFPAVPQTALRSNRDDDKTMIAN